jgi:hypothetical protein
VRHTPLTSKLGLLFLVGCQPEGLPDLPSEYIVPEEEAPPLLSLEEIEDALPLALNQFFALDLRQVLPTYEAFRAQGDTEGGCPFYFSDPFYGESITWITFETCDAQSTAVFHSPTLIQSMYSYPGDFVDELGNVYAEHSLLAGSGYIINPASESLQMGGDIFLDIFSPAQSQDTYTSLFIDGTFLHNGGDSWMQQNISWGFLDATAMDEPSRGVKNLTLNGSIAGFGGALSSLFFSTNSIQTTDGATCDLEPAGVLFARDASGYWYTVAFQGPESIGDFSAGCDGCGDVYVNDTLLGSVCGDFSSFVSWQGNPWSR